MRRMPTGLMSSFTQSLLKAPLTQIILTTLILMCLHRLQNWILPSTKVYSILASLDVTKATGIDGIGPRILKNCALLLVFPSTCCLKSV